MAPEIVVARGAWATLPAVLLVAEPDLGERPRVALPDKPGTWVVSGATVPPGGGTWEVALELRGALCPPEGDTWPLTARADDGVFHDDADFLLRVESCP